MLSNSPGGVNFEAAPFKLTRELLEVLDSNAEGRASEMFDYFKVPLSQLGLGGWSLCSDSPVTFVASKNYSSTCVRSDLECNKEYSREICRFGMPLFLLSDEAAASFVQTVVVVRKINSVVIDIIKK